MLMMVVMAVTIVRAPGINASPANRPTWPVFSSCLLWRHERLIDFAKEQYRCCLLPVAAVPFAIAAMALGVALNVVLRQHRWPKFRRLRHSSSTTTIRSTLH